MTCICCTYISKVNTNRVDTICICRTLIRLCSCILLLLYLLLLLFRCFTGLFFSLFVIYCPLVGRCIGARCTRGPSTFVELSIRWQRCIHGPKEASQLGKLQASPPPYPPCSHPRYTWLGISFPTPSTFLSLRGFASLRLLLLLVPNPHHLQCLLFPLRSLVGR